MTLMARWVNAILFLMLLAGCAQQSQHGLHPQGDSNSLPWEALLQDDPSNPDAHHHLAEFYSKRFFSDNHPKDKQLAITHAKQVLIARPKDFPAQTLLYGIYYSSVRKGDNKEFDELQQLFKEIPEQLRRGFYPPALASYLHQLDISPRDKNKELKLLLMASSEQPQNSLLHIQLSRYFFEANAIDLGFASLHQGLRAEPENSEILLALGDAYKSRAYHLECVYDHLDDIKQSVNFYQRALAQKPEAPQAHIGLMINYAHLGLAPLSLREGDIAVKQQNTPANQWVLAVFASYQGQIALADTLFAQMPNDTANRMVNRGYIEHLMIQAKWREAAKAFPEYIKNVKQPHIIDLIFAAIIRAELDDDSVKLNDLWQTDAKAMYFSAWDEALAKFWRSDITEQQFKQAVGNSCQAADYEFFVGYFKLLHNRIGEAKGHFEKARGFAQPMNVERKLAETLLHNF